MCDIINFLSVDYVRLVMYFLICVFVILFYISCVVPCVIFHNSNKHNKNFCFTPVNGAKYCNQRVYLSVGLFGG